MEKPLRRIYIEISNICNLQCTFCPEVERPKHVMSFDDFKVTASQAQGLADEVTLHLMGEPLTHPEIEKFIHYCGEIELPVNLTTNGVMLKNKNRMELLLHPAIRQVNFSLQSFTDNFPKKDPKEYLETVFTFTRLALEKRPDLYINYRLWNLGSDEDTLLGNAHFLKPIEQEFGYKLKNEVDVGFRKSRRITSRLYLHFDSRFEWPSLNHPVRSENGFCHALKDHIGIHADGTVVPCCLDKEAKIPLGKIGDGITVQDIISSPRAQAMRSGFASYKLIEELCRKCSFISRFDKKIPSKK